ncbi:MAG: hypothetical protein QM756_06500 [Polyangiaceae bacterium]
MHFELRSCAVALVLLGMSFGCGRVERDTVVEGQLELGSFPEAPGVVEAHSTTGNVYVIAPAANGAFKLSLPPGTYSIRVVSASFNEPLLFARQGGVLDGDFRITSGNATVGLGKVLHLADAKNVQFVADAPVSCEAEAEEEDDDESEGEEHEQHVESSGPEQSSQSSAALTPETVEGPIAVCEQNPPDQVGCDEDDDEEHED